MTWLSDSALHRLREAADFPDLTGTRYRVLSKLGEGGMGGVYEVEDTALSRQVALKVIALPDPGGDLAARLTQEAIIIASLEHPGIVPIHDAGSLTDGRAFYTMKLVRGERLDQYASRLAALPQRLRLFQKICEPVSFAHSHGVLHRDLKPANIMVGPFGEVLVMDWGLSKLLPSSNPAPRPASGTAETLAPSTTAHGTVLGTPGFMAPEFAAGNAASADHRADIFSLGAILNFLISPAATAPNALPKPLAATARKAMADDPAARYSTVEALAADVANFLDGLPVAAYPEPWPARLWKWIGRNRAWVLLVLAYLLMRALLIWWRR